MSANTDHILKALASFETARRLLISSATLLFLDYFLTLDLEIQYAWNGSWNLGRILFFLTRYSAFFEIAIKMYYEMTYSIPVRLCTKLYPVTAGLTIFGILVAELILSIRVWALWERRKDVGILLILMGVMDLSVAVVLFALYSSSYTFIPMDSLSPTITGCFRTYVGMVTNWPFVPLLVQQTIIFTLTAVKGTQHYLTGIYGTSLVNTFYRDGLVYYIVLIIPSIAILSMGIEYSGIFLCIQRVLHSILSARMLLHLRQEVDRSQSTLQTLTDIRFSAVEGSDDSSMHGVDPALVTQVREESYDSWFGKT